MAVALFSTLITLSFGAQIAIAAGLSNQVTCTTGHVTSNKACCRGWSKMCPFLLEYSLEWSPALFPVVDNIQQNLHGGGVCGFGVRISLIHSSRPHHPARRTQLFDWRFTTPLGSPFTVANQ